MMDTLLQVMREEPVAGTAVSTLLALDAAEQARVARQNAVDADTERT
jgi:hypothetical protein